MTTAMNQDKISYYFLGAAHFITYLAIYLIAVPARSGGWIVVDLLFASTLIWVSVVDLTSFRIPNYLCAPLAVAGLLITYIQASNQLTAHFAGAIAVFLFFIFLDRLFQHWRGFHGLGRGDAKLIGAGVLWVGPWAISEILLIASLGGIAYLLISGQGRSDKIPFGPFLAVAIWWAWVSRH